jgi:hypothetical protein
VGESPFASRKNWDADRSYQKVKSHADQAPSTAKKKAAKNDKEGGENKWHGSNGYIDISSDRGQSGQKGGENHPSQFFNGHRESLLIVNQVEK